MLSFFQSQFPKKFYDIKKFCLKIMKLVSRLNFQKKFVVFFALSNESPDLSFVRTEVEIESQTQKKRVTVKFVFDTSASSLK